MNLRMLESKTSALPLGDTPMSVINRYPSPFIGIITYPMPLSLKLKEPLTLDLFYRTSIRGTVCDYLNMIWDSHSINIHKNLPFIHSSVYSSFQYSMVSLMAYTVTRRNIEITKISVGDISVLLSNLASFPNDILILL